MGNAIIRTSRNFDATGSIRVVNFPGGGGARIDEANVRGPGGARAQVSGGSGVTYYWPSGGLRIDGDIQMGGGGLPSGRVSLRQARPGAPLSGVADLAPYSARGSRLALTPIRFGPGPADRPQSARSRSSTGRSRTGASRGCGCRSRAASGRAAASPSAPPAQSSASTTSRWARCSSVRRSCRFVRPEARSCPRLPGASCRRAPASVAPSLTAASATPRCA
jgi:hypothetical protein